MAAVPNPLHGFCRALAIAERTLMPTLKEQLPHIDMQCGILNTQEYERLIDREREQAQESEIETPHDGYISVDGLHQVSRLLIIDVFFVKHDLKESVEVYRCRNLDPPPRSPPPPNHRKPLLIFK